MELLKGYSSADAGKVTKPLDKNPGLVCFFGHAYNSLPGIYVLIDLVGTNLQGASLPTIINPTSEVPFCKHFNYYIPFKDIVRNILDASFDSHFTAYAYEIEGWQNGHPYSSVSAFNAWMSKIPVDLRMGFSPSEMMRVPRIVKEINASSPNNIAIQQRLYWIKRGMAEGITASSDLPIE